MVENTVEMVAANQQQDDAAQAESLSQIVGEQAQADQPTPAPVPERSENAEPGWIRKRIDAGVNKRLAEVREQIKAEYEAELAPLRESFMQSEAQKLVADGEFKSFDRALEYLKLKGGQPIVKAEQPTRDEKGRFAKTEYPEVQTRANELIAQANTIKAMSGIDVMSIYNNDPEVKERVLSGEWSFIDVYNSQKRMPQAIRSSNGGAIGDVDIARMTRGQLAKMDEYLSGGGKVRFR